MQCLDALCVVVWWRIANFFETTLLLRRTFMASPPLPNLGLEECGMDWTVTVSVQPRVCGALSGVLLATLPAQQPVCVMCVAVLV